MWKVLALVLLLPTAALAQQPVPPTAPAVAGPGEFGAHELHGKALWRALCKPEPPLTPDQLAYAKAFDKGDEARKHDSEAQGYDVYKEKADLYNARCAALKAEDEREQREEQTQRQEQTERAGQRVRVK